MSNDFDPYVEWLQIADPSRPPSHYALLGITELEPDRQRIETAAKKRVQSLQSLSSPFRYSLSGSAC